jgi:hypothetical protein
MADGGGNSSDKFFVARARPLIQRAEVRPGKGNSQRRLLTLVSVFSFSEPALPVSLPANKRPDQGLNQ